MSNKPHSWRLIHLLCAAVVILFALLLFSNNRADVDLWGNVGFVTALPGSSDFHTVNSYSFTEPHHPWINHEWGAEYILNKAFTLLGNPGLLLLKLLLGFALLKIINSALRRDCRSPAVRLLYLLLILSTLGYGFSTRPHLFTYLLTALLLSALLQPQLPRALLWGAAPLGCLWANLHGAFFTGEIMLIMATIWQLALRLTSRKTDSRDLITAAGATLLFFAGSLINPYGIRLWDFVFQSASITRTILSEWAPFNPMSNFSDHIDFIALVLLTLPAILIARKEISGFGLILLLLTLAAAFGMRRNIPLFAITAGLTAGAAVSKLYGRDLDNLAAKLPRRLLIILLAAAALLPATVWINHNRQAPLAIRISPEEFPVNAIEFLRANRIKANAIIFFDWAEYAIWHLYPDCKVFMDGRFRSAYSRQAIDDYINFIYAGKNFSKALTNYPTNLVLAHTGNPCAARMRQMPGWKLIYEDKLAVIFAKDSLLKTLDSPQPPPPTTPSQLVFP